MSIVKNTDGSDTAVTVWRFPKYNSQDPTTNIKGVLNDGTTVTSLAAKYYLELNNRAIGDNSGGQVAHIWNFYPGDTFILKLEIDESADGYIWGCDYQGYSVFIYKEDYVIDWVINNNLVGRVDWESGVHLYGWIGLESNGTKYSQPWYDGAVIPESSPQNFTGVGVSLLGGAYKGDYVAPDCISGSNYGIRIYEAVAESSEGSWHLYPCTVVSSSISWNTMFDALNKLGRRGMLKHIIDGSSQGGTASDSVGEFPADVNGIGVQLFDIKHITGSGYNDLIALVAEDGGIDTQAGWTSGLADTNPSKITKSGEADKNFAFYLGKSSNSTNIPVPSGYSVEKTGDTYAVGELIKGRKPKWNIWTDQIRFGKYAETTTLGRPKARFNIFYDNYGVNHERFELSRFEGYNSATFHAPHIGLSGTINFEYHNGFCCRLSEDTKLLGSSSQTDRGCIFVFNRDSGGLGNVRLGNLPLWNYSTAEQDAGAQTGLANLQACGAGLQVYVPIDMSGVVTNTEIAFMCKSVKDTGDMVGDEPISFCTTSNAATKAMFRDNGFDCTSIISNRGIEFMRDLLSESTPRTIRAKLVMTKNTSEVPTENAQIDCSSLVPDEVSSAVGYFDTNIYPTKTGLAGSQYDRFVLGENGGTCTIGSTIYQIGTTGATNNPSWGKQSNEDDYDYFNHDISYTSQTSTGTSYGRAIAIGIGLKEQSSNTLLSILQAGSGTNPNMLPLTMAFAEVTAYDQTTGGATIKTCGFTKVISVVYDSTRNDYWRPFAFPNTGPDYQTYGDNKVWPWNISGDGVSYSQTKRGAAMFMWKDLIMNRNTSTARPTEGVTCHMRVFGITSGIHSWMPYSEGIVPTFTSDGSARMDLISENLFTPTPSSASIYSTIKDIYFHNPGVLLENDLATISNSLYVDAWITLWSTSPSNHVHSTSAQIISQTALSGSTITLYEEVLHEPKDSASGSNPVELCHFTMAGTTAYGKNSNNQDTGHVCTIETNQLAPFYSRLPINSARSGQFTNGGFYRIKIYHTSTQPSTGSMYYIKIS